MTSQEPGASDPYFEPGPTEEIPAATGARPEDVPASQPGGIPRSASADRATINAFRPRRVIPAVVTAVLMTALGVFVALEVISALVGHPLRLLPYDRMLTWASSTPWSDPRVMWGATVVGLLGLLLVLLALIPGRPTLIPVRTGDRDLMIGMQRRGFTRSLAHAAERVQGINRARVRLVGKSVRVDADSGLRDTTGLADAVREAVTGRIAALSPVWNHPVHVRLRGK